MGIKTIVTAEAFGELPDTLQGLYKENGSTGDYVLQIDGINKHPEVVNLKTAHEKVKKGIKAFRDFANGNMDVDEDDFHDDVKSAFRRIKAKVSNLPDDFSIEAYEELKKTAEGKGAPTDEQMAALRERYETQSRQAIEPLQEENDKLKNSIRRMTIDGAMSNAMDAALIDPIHKPKIMAFLKSSAKIDVEEVDGQYRAVVDGEMGHQTMPDFVADYAGSEDGKHYVAKSGGPNPDGNSGGRRGAKTITRAEYEALPIMDRKAVAQERQIVD